MRITVLYPASHESYAAEAKLRLARIRNLDIAWLSTDPATFQDDLEEAAESEDPLVLVLHSSLIDKLKLPPRTLWAPLLAKIEAGGAGFIGVCLLNAVNLPPLFKQAKVAQDPHSLRALNQWVLRWMQIEYAGGASKANLGDDLREDLFTQLIDQEATTTLSCTCASTRLQIAQDFKLLAAPHFEAVHLIDTRHQVLALRDTAVAEIQPQGRTLWILNGYEGPPLDRPEAASILILNSSGGRQIPASADPAPTIDPIARAATLIPQIPTVEDQPLPFSTYEFEDLLPQLFTRNWMLAERLARRAGAFFRVNHRVSEAIWLYESLRDQAELQGHANCRQDCENELYWLRAAGPRKKQLAQAEQGSLF
jgi:hypothetical protein